MPTTSTRRPDIDGIRALAIVAVVAFHAGWLPGGFIGVDLFFVLSGYLMATLLTGDLANGRWSPGRFYLRRVYRLVPALAAMTVAVAIAGSLLLLPIDLPGLGRVITATATFTSNLRFHEIANDYFLANSLSEQPLLHTWTLSVEMQFYIVFPLLVWLGWRLRERAGLCVTLAILALASIAWSVATRHDDPGAVFYLMPARLWELLLGALTWLAPAMTGRWRAPAIAVGAGLIGAGLWLCRPGPSFPMPDAGLPVLGAVLLLAARPGTLPGDRWSAALLRHPAIVATALISYSLYLWHWPLLALARYRLGERPGLALTVALLALAIVLAGLSWRFVERPCLKPGTDTRRRWYRAATAIVAVGLVGAVLRHAGPTLAQGWFPAAVATLTAAQDDHSKADCDPGDPAPETPCRFGAATAPASVLLWGNSFARMWLPGIDALTREHGVSGIASVRSSCMPSLAEQQPGDCLAFNRATLDRIAREPGLTRIVIAANWIPDTRLLPRIRGLLDAIGTGNREIHLLLGPPQPGFPVPRRIALAALRGQAVDPTFPVDHHARERDAIRTALEPLVADGRLRILDPTEAFCTAGHCRVRGEQGEVLYYDGAHLTGTAARLMRSVLSPIVGETES